MINMDDHERRAPVIQLNEVFPGDTNALDTLFGGSFDVDNGYSSWYGSQ